MTWTTIQRGLVIVGAATAVAGLLLGWQELRSIRLNQSAELTLEIDRYLAMPVSLQIMDAIERKSPVLQKNGGRFSTWQLDAYLGTYETLANLYESGLLTEEMVYSAFSYNLEKAYKNPEIRGYVRKVQAEDPEVFAGFMELAEALSKK